MSSFLQEYLPEERSRYPEHIFHNPFDQPDLLVEMVLCLHIQNSKMVKRSIELRRLHWLRIISEKNIEANRVY